MPDNKNTLPEGHAPGGFSSEGPSPTSVTQQGRERDVDYHIWLDDRAWYNPHYTIHCSRGFIALAATSFDQFAGDLKDAVKHAGDEDIATIIGAISSYISGNLTAILNATAGSARIRIDGVFPTPVVIAMGDDSSHRSDSDLMYSYLYDGSWSGTGAMTGMYTTARPALAVYQNKLHILCRGTEKNGQVWHTTMDTTSGLSAYTQVPKMFTGHGPSLASYQRDGKLHGLLTAADSTQVWHAVYDGSGWSYNPVTGMYTSESPTLVEYKGQLHGLLRGTGGSTVWHAKYDGGGWSYKQVPYMYMSGGAGLTVHQGRLHGLCRSGGSIWHATSTGSDWSYTQTNLSAAADNIALASYNDTKLLALYLVEQQVMGGDPKTRLQGAEWQGNNSWQTLDDGLYGNFEKSGAGMAYFNNKMYAACPRPEYYSN